MTIGERIRDRRIELGLSQIDLAERVGITSKSTICKIEKGGDNLNNVTVAKYAKALHTTPAYLMGWTEEDSAPGTKTAALDAELLYKFNKLTEPRKRSVLQVIDALLDVQDN